MQREAFARPRPSGRIENGISYNSSTTPPERKHEPPGYACRLDRRYRLATRLDVGARDRCARGGGILQGKRIQMVIGWDVGGGYDIYARLLARHIGKHIPGNPTIVPQNMPGAGSRLAANWLHNAAPKDGTAIATIGQGTPLDQAINEPGVRYDAARLNWIGNPIIDNLVTAVSQQSGVATLDDLKKSGGLYCGDVGRGRPRPSPRSSINCWARATRSFPAFKA